MQLSRVRTNLKDAVSAQLLLSHSESNRPGRIRAEDFHLQSVELFSDSGEYSSGVFRKLFEHHRTEIRKFVRVTVRDFDPGYVQSMSDKTNVWTWAGTREWIEVDFLDRQFVASAYRLGRHRDILLRSWSLLGSHDRTIQLNEWAVIDSRSEETPGELGNSTCFDCSGGAYRYFRLVSEGLDWRNHTWLILNHFELFGLLIAR
jgi:hypothetical protein